MFRIGGKTIKIYILKEIQLLFSCKKVTFFIFNDFMIKWEQETRPKGIEVICIL